MAELRNHRFPEQQFRLLAQGGGNPETVRALLAGERSRRLLMLRTFLNKMSEKPDRWGPLASSDQVWQALEAIEMTDCAALNAVLLSPQFGIWLARSLRLIRGAAASPAPPWVEFGNIHGATVAAAIRARSNLETRIPIFDGRAMLPTLGIATFSGAGSHGVVHALVVGGRARLRSERREVHVPADPATDAPHWQGLRRAVSRHDGRTLDLWLDDIDPYRDLADPVPPRRLTEPDLAAWRSLFDSAWRVLVRTWPEQAEAMRAGLTSVATLPSDEGYEVRSASSGDGFGAALISRPNDADALAASLVHEFQHIKLGGILYLIPMLEPSAHSQFTYAPWRDDPRPLSGLLQGIYAFHGISSYWLRRRGNAPAELHQAIEFEFAYSRRQTRLGMATLRRSPLLTPAGRAFVDLLAGRIDAQQAVPVPPAANRAAWALSTEHRATWRIRHLEPDPEAVARLAHAFRQGGPPRTSGVTRFGNGSGGPVQWNHGRLALQRRRLRSPHAFAALTRPDARIPPDASGAVQADIRFLAGDSEAAEAAYRAMIMNDPADVDAWSGLAVAAAANASTPAWRLLVARPELVRATYQAARESQPGPITPLAVAEWLDAASAQSPILPFTPS